MTLTPAPAARHRIARWVLWGALAIHAPIALVAAANGRLPHADIDNYYTIGTTAGRPYVDFAVEFPIGTAQAFRTLAPLTGTREVLGVEPNLHELDREIGVTS